MKESSSSQQRSSQSSTNSKNNARKRKFDQYCNDFDIENQQNDYSAEEKKLKFIVELTSVDLNVSSQSSQSTDDDSKSKIFDFNAITDTDGYETFIEDVDDSDFCDYIVKMLKCAPLDRRLVKWENCIITGMMFALFDQNFLFKSVRLAGEAPDGSTEVVLTKDKFPFMLLEKASGLDESQVKKSLKNLFSPKIRKSLMSGRIK